MTPPLENWWSYNRQLTCRSSNTAWWHLYWWLNAALRTCFFANRKDFCTSSPVQRRFNYILKFFTFRILFCLFTLRCIKSSHSDPYQKYPLPNGLDSFFSALQASQTSARSSQVPPNAFSSRWLPQPHSAVSHPFSQCMRSQRTYHDNFSIDI